MKYTPEEVMQFVQEEDVKFIRLAFCNVYGKQHNVAIMPAELKRAFTYGIAFDASAVEGFGGEIRSDLLLHPDPSTLIQLPWRPEQGKVVRMFCDISYPDGRPFERDTRSILKRAAATPRPRASALHLARRWSSICSVWTNTASPPGSPMTGRATWTSRRMTGGKRSAGRSA